MLFLFIFVVAGNNHFLLFKKFFFKLLADMVIPCKLGLALLKHPSCVWQLELSAGVVPLLSLLLFLDAAQFGLLGSLV